MSNSSGWGQEAEVQFHIHSKAEQPPGFFRRRVADVISHFFLFSPSHRAVKGQLAQHLSHQSASVTNYYWGPQPSLLIPPLNKHNCDRTKTTLFLAFCVHMCMGSLVGVMFKSGKYPDKRLVLESHQTKCVIPYIRHQQRCSKGVADTKKASSR